jgi:hypothetical protein
MVVFAELRGSQGWAKAARAGDGSCFVCIQCGASLLDCQTICAHVLCVLMDIHVGSVCFVDLCECVVLYVAVNAPRRWCSCEMLFGACAVFNLLHGAAVLLSPPAAK